MSLSAVPTAPHEGHTTGWCQQHHPEGCLSVPVQIPGLPLTIWAATGTEPGTVQIVIDGADDGQPREVLIPL